ncbi:Lrp/AsnC family transcriptional regulator [Streptomyces sporangiiformans]|uniref:Lrp/AsnC family transcriptional regulator n=1 Tax=Streptomyces sporangiiformans TaxID=2315329 RepID=A0A505DH42_9ACTN|nr:Lrp/AsnC family transcriptional regulator [Streptomyces sporangiiformans]TPQ22507.1 Lrp/AsnC family transcriptional regulator [Streptomyces sporangiiformans]
MEFPTLDRLDLQVLHALQLDGRAPFSRIATALGVSDQTVARRYRQLRTTANVRVLGMTHESLLGRQNWIVRLHCVPDVAEQLADALAKRPDTLYVSLMSGGTEVFCGMKPRSLKERDELLFDRLQRTPQIVTVTAHCLLHRFYGGPHGWLNKSNALTPDQEAALRLPTPVPLDAPVTLDTADEALLAVLRRDGRATLTELQRAIGQSEPAVKRRLEALRSTGVLYFDVQCDHAPLGHGVGAMLWLTVAPRALADAGRSLAAHPEVHFASATTGQANIVVATHHRSPDELYTYLSEKIGVLDGIQAVESALILRQIKQLTYEPNRTADRGT